MNSEIVIFTVENWLYGLGYSTLFGGAFTYLFHKMNTYFFSKTAKEKGWWVKRDEVEQIPCQPMLIGLLERLFFTLLVAFNISGVATAMLTWMLLKMATGWNRIQLGETWRRMLSFQALLNGIVSLLFALIGGLMVNGKIVTPYSDIIFVVSFIALFISWMYVIIYENKYGFKNDKVDEAILVDK